MGTTACTVWRTAALRGPGQGDPAAAAQSRAQPPTHHVASSVTARVGWRDTALKVGSKCGQAQSRCPEALAFRTCFSAAQGAPKTPKPSLCQGESPRLGPFWGFSFLVYLRASGLLGFPSSAQKAGRQGAACTEAALMSQVGLGWMKPLASRDGVWEVWGPGALHPR